MLSIACLTFWNIAPAYGGGEIIELLSSSQNGQSVLSSLRELTLVVVGNLKSTPRTLSEAFQYRFRKAGLRCGMVTQRDDWRKERFHPEDLDRFRSLQEQGYDMNLGHGGADANAPRWKEPLWHGKAKWNWVTIRICLDPG